MITIAIIFILRSESPFFCPRVPGSVHRSLGQDTMESAESVARSFAVGALLVARRTVHWARHCQELVKKGDKLIQLHWLVNHASGYGRRGFDRLMLADEIARLGGAAKAAKAGVEQATHTGILPIGEI